MILEPNKIKSVTASTFSPSVCHEVMEPVAMILVVWMLNFKPAFSLCYLLWVDGNGCHDLCFLNVDFKPALSSFTLIKRLFSSSLLSAIRVVSSAYLRLLIFLPAIDASLWFIQSSVLHDVLCIEVKWPGWQYTALMYSFLNFKPVHCSMSGSNWCFLTCI